MMFGLRETHPDLFYRLLQEDDEHQLRILQNICEELKLEISGLLWLAPQQKKWSKQRRVTNLSMRQYLDELRLFERILECLRAVQPPAA